MKNLKLFTLVGLFSILSIKSQAQAIKIDNYGKVGIGGIPSSAYQLNVYGNLRSAGNVYVYDDLIMQNSSNVIAGVETIYNSSSYGQMDFLSSTTLKIIGGSETTKTLDVYGNVYFNGSLYSSSDERLKKDINSIDNLTIIEKISRIEGKKYKFKNREEMLELHKSGHAHFLADTVNLLEIAENNLFNETGSLLRQNSQDDKEMKKMIKDYLNTHRDSLGIDQFINDTLGIVIKAPRYEDKEHFGLLAQNVIMEFPELVVMDSVSGLYSIEYLGFVPLLLEAFKEQQKQNMKLEERVSKLESMLLKQSKD